MAKIERHFASEPLQSQTFPRAPSGRIADVGAGFLPRALTGLGETIGDIGTIVAKWYEREGNSQFDTAVGESRRLIGEFERTSFADSDEHDKAFKLLESNIAKSAGGNKVGARKFKGWIGLNKDRLDKISAEKKIRMIDQQNQVALFKNLSNVARDYKDPVEAKARIETLIQGGLDDKSIRTAAQAIALREKMTENWIRTDVWRRATAFVRPDGEVDWSQAVKWFSQKENIEGIDSQVIDGLLEDARSQMVQQRIRDEEKGRALANETETQAWNLWRDNKLTEDWLRQNQDVLGRAFRDKYTAVVDAETNAEIEKRRELAKIAEEKTMEAKERKLTELATKGEISGKDIDALYFKGDIDESTWKDVKSRLQTPVISFESLATLQDAIEEVSFVRESPEAAKTLIMSGLQEWLQEGVPRETAVATAEQYRFRLSSVIQKLKDPKDATNTETAQTYLKLLKEAETDRIFSLDKAQNSIVYGQKKQAMMDFFRDFKKRTGNDASDKDAQEFYEQFVGAYRKPESPFTEAKAQQMLGELQSGGAISIFGTVIPFFKAEDAINHALRTLGPDWQEISPQAAGIIKKKWPEADLTIAKPKTKAEFTVGQRVTHTNGGIYEYTGEPGDKAWSLVKE